MSKKKTIRLKGKALREFRKKIYVRDKGLCQNCGKFVPLTISGYFDKFLCAHIHHLKTRGSGGEDVPENVVLLCWDCHRGVHDGRITLKEKEDEN